MTFLAELKRRKAFKVGAAHPVVAWLMVPNWGPCGSGGSRDWRSDSSQRRSRLKPLLQVIEPRRFDETGRCR